MAADSVDLSKIVQEQKKSAVNEENERAPVQKARLARDELRSSYESPHRHHHRNLVARRPVKETLNARSEYTTSQDDGTAEHKINQYIIKEEIGRGSFGSVHLAVDQFGNEYAVKEFSKLRLRKRAQSHLLRRPRAHPRPTSQHGFHSHLHRQTPGNEDDQTPSPLLLIQEEIAIMKKLNHPNLVSLIEVLDDPTEDSVYMVMEMCKKGVIMKIGLGERADPYDDERCRYWFRDLILGIEYLHAQGIVHRDIKPDNCLLTSDDVLKVVDFGVSEMFEKDSSMYTAKSAGSPAFLPPELCIAKHGDVSGKAADIWSMGVTLYCLRYGRLPFERESIFELYDAIRNDPVVCEGETDEQLEDLMLRILEKDPTKRITMRELREHPWVTGCGSDPLLSEEENTADIVEPPTEEEMNSAITKNMGHLLAVVRAVQHFKRLLDPSRIHTILGNEFGSQLVESHSEIEPGDGLSSHRVLIPHRAQGLHIEDRKAWERELVLNSYRQAMSNGKDSESARSHNIRNEASPQSKSPWSSGSRENSATAKRSSEGTHGQAHDPLEDHPYLFIGPSTYNDSADGGQEIVGQGDRGFDEPNSVPNKESDGSSDSDESVPVVSESPGPADFDIYEAAYRQEVERIRSRPMPEAGTTGPVVYLTHRVEHKHDVIRLVQEKVEKAEEAISSILKHEPSPYKPNPQLSKKAKALMPILASTVDELSNHFSGHQPHCLQGQQPQTEPDAEAEPEPEPEPERSTRRRQGRSRSSISSPSTVQPATAAVDARGETVAADVGNGAKKLRNLLSATVWPERGRQR